MVRGGAPMYKIFLLFLFLIGSVVCYHADQTIADDNGYPEAPLDAEVVVEFPKKCNCDHDKTDEALKKQEIEAEQAGKNLSQGYIAANAIEPIQGEPTAFVNEHLKK